MFLDRWPSVSFLAIYGGCKCHSVQSPYLYVDPLEARTGSFVFNTIATCQGKMGDGGRMVHDDEIRGC